MRSKTLSKNLDSLYNDWVRYKKEAIKTGDFKQYNDFLRAVQSEFTKLYARVTKPELVSLIENILKTTSCELKENSIKYNKQNESRQN